MNMAERSPSIIDSRPLRGAAALISSIALGLAMVACSAGDEGNSVPEYQGGNGFNAANGGQATNPGLNASPQNPGVQGDNTAGGGNSVVNPPLDDTQTAGNAGGGQVIGDNGAGGSGNDNGPTGVGGSMAGTAGVTMPPGQGGSGLGQAGSSPTDDGQPPPNDSNPPPPVPPPPTPPPPVIDTACPANAFFCAGFEGSSFPAGTNNVVGGAPIPNAFVLDDTEANSGQQSLLITPVEGFAYRVMAIPAPGQRFWVRLFVQVDVEFGRTNHGGIFGASDVGLQQDHNGEVLIELSEQFGYMLTNIDDDTSLRPDVEMRLAANQWHCMEARYDGDAGEIEIFVEGQRIINETRANARMTFRTFRIGNMQYTTTGGRSVWYDDVVLAPERVGCN